MINKAELMRGFEFGPWRVMPDRGLVSDGASEHKLEPLVMDVFVMLASHEGSVVSKDQLVDAVWSGRAQTDDVITRCIAALRRTLGDDARNPAYIETIQRRGYRVVPSVVPIPEQTAAPRPASKPMPATPRARLGWILGAFAALCIGVFFWINNHSATPDAGVSSVIVFPFSCLRDTEASTDHLCFGFAEEAISSLNKVAGLTVVRNRENFEAKAPLDTDALVTGSVQIIADEVRISAQLEDNRTGVVLWSNTFDADQHTIFELQKAVAYQLRSAVDADFVAPALASGIPASFAAAEAYSRGRYFFEKRDHKSIQAAIAQFEEAIRLDPNFGPSWLGLAYTYTISPDYDLSVNREASYDKALQTVNAGIAADRSIRQAAGTVVGFVHHKRNEWIAAADAFETALRSADVEPIAYHWYSRVMASVGRLDLALDASIRALELDPNHPDQAIMVSRLAIAYLWLNDMHNAGRYFEISNSMGLQASIHSLSYSLYLIRSGDIDGAKAFAKAGLQQNNVDARWVDPVFDGLKVGADVSRSLAILAQLADSGALPENVEMTLWMLFGEVDRAMQVARRLERQGGLFELEIIFIDEFAALRQHREFPAFVEAIGLTEYWLNAGCRWNADSLTCS